jgi:multiple sugar transport system substrate-binding protein
VVAAFEQESGKQVELTHYSNSELPDKLEAALEAGHPPDFAFGLTYVSSKWAFEDRLVDLTDTVGAFSNLFDPEALAWWFQLNGTTRQRALYALPMGRSTIHLHVWKSLMEQAGFTPADIPKEWDAFWSFWCDEVQPAVRQALGRDDIYGIGLNMSGKATEVNLHFLQFLDAYDAEYVTGDGELVIDDPLVQQRIVKAIDSYAAIYRKGCTPPSSITWDSNRDNNQQFLAGTVVMVMKRHQSAVAFDIGCEDGDQPAIEGRYFHAGAPSSYRQAAFSRSSDVPGLDRLPFPSSRARRARPRGRRPG